MQPISSPPGRWPGKRLLRALLFAIFLVALGLVAVAMLGGAHLLEDHDELHVGEARATELLGDRHAQQTDFAHGGEDGGIRLLLRIGVDDPWQQPVLGEVTRRIADQPLVLGQLVFEEQRVLPVERARSRAMLTLKVLMAHW